MGSDTAIIVRATDDAVLGWSLGAAKLSGYRADEIVGRSLRVVLPSAAHASGGRATLIRKGGIEVPVTWTHTPVHDERGRLVAFTDVLSPIAPARGGCDTRAERSTDAQADLVRGRAAIGPRVDAERRRAAAMLVPDALDPAVTFQQIVESLPILGWVASVDGSCRFLSSGWCAYTGYAHDELLERGWVKIVHPDDLERTFAALQVPRKHDDPLVLELRFRRHDGAYRWFEVRATMLGEAHDASRIWFGANTEVHEAHLTFDALKNERERLERVIGSAPGAFFSYRLAADGTVSLPEASPAMQALLGETSEVLNAGLATLAYVHPDDRVRVQASVDASARGLHPWKQDYRMLTRHRGTIWILGRSVPVAQPDGSIQWFGFLEDISERKHAEESLRTAQAQLVAALEAGGMGTSRWDARRDRMELHESLRMLFGWARDEARRGADDFLPFVAEEDRAGVREALASRADEISFTYRVQRPDGDVRSLAARGRRERGPGSGAEHVMLLHVDVTNQRRVTELQLRSQKLEALGTLAGGIAHDFNNMLHAIAGNCALALRRVTSDHPARGLLEAIAIASDRAADLVRRLLQVSRPAEQRRDILKLRDIVREALKLVRSTVPSGLEIREQLGSDDPYVEVDATQIHQIILNLAANASHAIGAGRGFLQVRLELLEVDLSAPHAPPVAHGGSFAALHVSDNGTGMDAATAERIFDPFFTTKPVGKGTGLGLSMVHGIMTSLGGGVAVRSVLGEGSTFLLYFPRSEPPITHALTPPVLRCDRCSGRVLFVDDEEILVELGARTLEALGYEVLAFARPRDALRAFLDQPDAIDAVITDLAMPEQSGFDLAARVLEVRPELPVVMMSGNVGADELAIAQRLGLSDVLIKPVSMEALERTLGKALRHAARRNLRA